jgi:hypothetical protein
MSSLVVTIAPEHDKTRVLMADEHRDLLKAVLPPPRLAHPRAAITVLEGLALWQQQRLSVVLVADESDRTSGALSLCDALGFGERTLHYEVAVACRERRRARRRIDGIANFRDLHQLRLEVDR